MNGLWYIELIDIILLTISSTNYGSTYLEWSREKMFPGSDGYKLLYIAFERRNKRGGMIDARTKSCLNITVII